MKSSRNYLAVLIIILTVYWSFYTILPSATSSKKEISATEFSIDNALYHLKNISQKPHHTGSEEHKNVQNYLVQELQKLNLEPEIQYQTAINKKWRAATTTENIIAKIKGTENGKALLLLTHYDSNPHSSLGASDAGSGVVTILEGIRAYLAANKTPKNDIIILFSDAEELGLLGAQAFVENHPWAKDVGLVLNFEARGSGGSSYMLMETNGKNKTLLTEFLNANPNYPAANSLMYDVYKKLPNDTDLTVFREKGNINGFNFAFIDDHFDYHTEQDSYERLNRETLLHQADYFTTSLNYFANADLTNLNSDTDYIYVNFPFTKLLTYPFSWVLPMLIIAFLLFIVLVVVGIYKKKMTVIGLLKGFIPYILSLVLCIAISYGLWQLLLIIHPQYTDMLHGFTYNGYQYIIAFVLLNLWILFKVYNKLKEAKAIDLLIAPITFGLVINVIIYMNLPGAGFFIIPVFASLFILVILLFMNINKASRAALFAIISIPSIYMIAPMVQLFPVALGLKTLFISAILLVFLFGLMLPVFYQEKTKNGWQTLTGFLALLFFGYATFNSGFSIEKKKPNSLVFIQNSDSNSSYWASHNKTLDGYTKQYFNDESKQGGADLMAGKSKYNTSFNYYQKAENKNIRISNIKIHQDTIINSQRNVSFTITPTRNIDKYELYTNTQIELTNFTVNGTLYDKGKAFTADKGTLLIYQMANTDKDLTISFTIDKNTQPDIVINEISNDLLSHPKFTIRPRSEIMMPMPFVVNDAIICTRKLKL
ncbi:Peptidase family M28 [Tenacibaculum mesophilum]|uniref:M20/M25/M40 family metallo-hydrolase n=1 Tax=Tenacibaculum mesophilum TaxID=104268 RepID=A0ABM7CGA2_9FLAO|nr:M20/M25/M40 family metallo-hydrolase [Tenacibaculum mesophilum]AZJ32831.1 M20/M25/M40 family metallo-hydrolase [Tenacibaculum mesophilum]QFS28078.1 M20/M25/M40 family metallo-hydrolase [Tenacibaculum mesophilum]SHF73227.1 Peptidase family M28 [Tenacibaculum mesophilum]